MITETEADMLLAGLANDPDHVMAEALAEAVLRLLADEHQD